MSPVNRKELGARVSEQSDQITVAGDRFAVGRVSSQETLLCAGIDLSDTIRGEYDLDVIGHNARPDVGVQV
jgi:hypothetical protein